MDEALPVNRLPERLLECARAEFSRHGFAKANVGRIAATAMMSKKTVYRHVASKEMLLLAVMRSVAGDLAAVAGAPDPDAPAEAWLTGYLKAFCRLAFSDEGITSYRLFISEGAQFPDTARIYNAAIKAYGIGPLADQLAAYASAGQMAIDDAEATAMMLVSMVVSDALREAALGLSPPPDEADLHRLIRRAVTIFLGGVMIARKN
ncbi:MULTISPECIES: TetR/AcrR family transcriptional regulator [unclassified Sphingomonas]|nr:MULTISPECIES: TetR/AcrR family transcriptional regulator [unclassified Sphingomonas]